jgi:translation initiation factor 4B
MERGGSRRGQGGFNEGDGKVRDFSNWERKGPLSPVPQTEQPMRGGGRVRTNDGPRERKNSPSWGEGQGRDGSRPRGEFREREPRPQSDRQPTPAELDNQWRSRMRPDAAAKSASPTPSPSAPSSPAQPAPPGVRPRLNLQKRTVSEAQPAQASAPADSSKPNPFGGARPIDTAAREREIEEKHQLQLRLKKEQDDKAREERRAKEAAAKAAAAEEAASVASASENGKANDETENGSEGAKARSYQILSRADDEGNEAEGKETPDAPANGDIVEDKAVKPREPTREPPRGPKSQPGSWRRKPSNQGTPASPSTSTAEKVEEDGWSTVQSTNKRGRGRGNAGRHAVAS